MMNASTPSTIQQLRERDGEDCWLCDGKLSFAAPPNSKKAPTKEHLIALALGGSGALENLVLCHPGCNRQLGMRPVADKLKMREKRIATRAKQAAKAKSASKSAPIKSRVFTNVPVAPRPEAPVPNWQRAAMIATASAAFFAGLCLGMLIG